MNTANAILYMVMIPKTCGNRNYVHGPYTQEEIDKKKEDYIAIYSLTHEVIVMTPVPIPVHP